MRLQLTEVEVLPATGGAFSAALEMGALKGSAGTRPVYADVFEI